MGFLGFGNYSKPGPGVSKDEPEKAAPVRFFEIFFRTFWKLVQVNLLFALPMILALVIFVFIFIGSGYTMNLLSYAALLPMILVSPFVAGLTMITRNFVRVEHAFIWSDFIKAVKNNFKLFLINGVVCYGAFFILSIAIRYYFSLVSTNAFFYVPLALCLMITILFLFAQYYMPMLLITFDLKYRQALKNAFLLGVLGMGRNFLITVILAALLVGMFFLLYFGVTIIIAFILVIFILFAFCSYMINFISYPVIKKFMIDPQNAPAEAEGEKSDSDSAASEKEASLSYWEELTEEDQDEDAYVYVNGRMIKRSELKEK